MYLSRKNAVRILLLTLAVLLAAVGFGAMQYQKAIRLERQVEYGYLKSLTDAATCVSNLNLTLEKGVFAGTPAQMTALSARLWKDASAAKAAIASLPMGELELENTYRFLSQVGDYAMSLAKKAETQQEITEKEKERFSQFREYAAAFSRQLSQLESDISSGSRSIHELQTHALSQRAGEEQPQAGSEDAADFSTMEAGFEGYAALIYDGPFSDHILKRKPRLVEGREQVTRETARATAARMCGLPASELRDGSDEHSSLPLFTFESGEHSAGVTKQGGLPVYFSYYRAIDRSVEGDLSDAIAAAKRYLTQLGYDSMQENYYEIAEGIVTVNFAYMQDGTTCYTDLIKVGVALDDLSVVFFDARGFIFNHTQRAELIPALSREEAARSISPSLSVRNSKLALIPTSGLDEVLAYEFLCDGPDGEEILVYINAVTGVEEQLLILIQNENGSLTA